MSSREFVDPQLRGALDQFPGFTLTASTLGQMRDLLAELATRAPPDKPPNDVSVEERRVAGRKGTPDIRVLVFRPRDAKAPRPAYFHIHGGGYVMGSPEMTSDNSIALARELGCVVVSAGYRLAPETTYPGQIEDCYAALKWLHVQAQELGVDPQRIAIGGESAGAGLAAALALLARDRKEIPLIFQLLIYPMIDDRTALRTDIPSHHGEFIWTRENNYFGWKSLLGEEPGGNNVSPYAAAARAEDLSGLPPAFIGVGSLDLFLEENINYASRLLRAGVPTELHVYPGAFHGFEMAVDADVAKRAVQSSRNALRRALNPE
jgi:acetyl esterase/lipase